MLTCFLHELQKLSEITWISPLKKTPDISLTLSPLLLHRPAHCLFFPSWRPETKWRKRCFVVWFSVNEVKSHFVNIFQSVYLKMRRVLCKAKRKFSGISDWDWSNTVNTCFCWNMRNKPGTGNAIDIGFDFGSVLVFEARHSINNVLKSVSGSCVCFRFPCV